MERARLKGANSTIQGVREKSAFAPLSLVYRLSFVVYPFRSERDDDGTE